MVAKSIEAAAWSQAPQKAGVKEIARHDGAVYRGEVDASGQACGCGVQRWPNNVIYEGEWKDNVMCGFGRLSSPDKSEYSGNWDNGVQEGPGLHNTRDGGRYEGQWSRGRMHGRGEYIWKDGAFSWASSLTAFGLGAASYV